MLHDDWPRPAEVLRFFEATRSILIDFRNRIQLAESPIVAREPFLGKTSDEIVVEMQKINQELSRKTVMGLASSVEAIFQVDARRRIVASRKTSFSRRMQTLLRHSTKHSGWVRIEDILKIWAQEEPRAKGAIERLKHLFLFRNWLAHGQYWTEKRSGLRDPDPFEAWNLAKDVLNRLPGFDPI